MFISFFSAALIYVLFETNRCNIRVDLISIGDRKKETCSTKCGRRLSLKPQREEKEQQQPRQDRPLTLDLLGLSGGPLGRPRPCAGCCWTQVAEGKSHKLIGTRIKKIICHVSDVVSYQMHKAVLH